MIYFVKARTTVSELIYGFKDVGAKGAGDRSPPNFKYGGKGLSASPGFGYRNPLFEDVADCSLKQFQNF